jgi:hypothetical protein
VILPSSVYAQTGDLNIIPKTDVISAAYPRHGGWAVNPELQAAYVADAGLAVPANARSIGGWAFTDDGALYVTSDAVTGPFTWINGFKTRQDGALVVLNRAGVPATDPYPLGWAADGATGAALVGGISFSLPLSDAGAGVVNLTPFTARGSATPTFTRATAAWTVLSNGLIAQVANGQPRSYYDPSSVVTNIALQSQTLDVGGTWLRQNNAVVYADTAVAPDGTWTADRIETGGVGPAPAIRQALTLDVGATYTASFYVKQGNVNTWFAGLRDTTAATWLCQIAFNGTSIQLASGAGTFSSTDVGDGWTRVSFTCAVGVNSTISYYFYPETNGVSTPGKYVYGWGFQLEKGATTGAYVATTTVARSVAQTYLGYLAEGQRTNLETFSEAFDNAAWTKVDVTITADNTVAPDGQTTADLCTEGVAGTSATTQAVTATADVNHTVSCFFKPGTAQWVRLRIIAGANAVNCWLDIVNGVVGNTTPSGAATFANASIQRYANGWFRCSVTGNVLGGATSISLQFMSAASNGAGRLNNATYYAWGAQFENNVSFASSYIPTAGSTVTRNADVLTYPFAGNASATEGTVYAEGSTLWSLDPVASAILIALTDANGRALYSSSTVPSTSIATFDGTNAASKGALSAMATGVRKRAASYGAAGLLVTGDGASPGTGTFDGSMGGGSGNIGIGCNPVGGSQFFGTLKNVQIYQSQFSAAQLQAITS